MFNPAPLTAVNSATPAVKTLQSHCRIYLKVPNFSLVPLLHAGFGFWGYARSRSDMMGVRGLLHAAPCVAGHWLPKYYTAISELRKKVKMGKHGNVAGVVFLNSNGNKKAGIFAFAKHQSSAWQSFAVTCPAFAGVNSG